MGQGMRTERPLAALLRVVLCCCRQIGLRYFCVGIGNVRGELSGGEGIAGGVLPGAGESIVCADEFEGGAGGEAGEGATVIEHVAHIRHVFSIQWR